MPAHRKSLEDHVRDGTYRADRHGPLPEGFKASVAAAKPIVHSLPCGPLVKPADLKGEAEKVWNALLPLLGSIATERDAPLLADLCTWWAELGRVRVRLKKVMPGEVEYNRLLIAAGICADKVDKIAARFGLTPADRAKLRIDTGPAKPKIVTRPRQFKGEDGPPPAAH